MELGLQMTKNGPRRCLEVKSSMLPFQVISDIVFHAKPPLRHSHPISTRRAYSLIIVFVFAFFLLDSRDRGIAGIACKEMVINESEPWVHRVF